jgi:hypothetical protein
MARDLTTTDAQPPQLAISRQDFLLLMQSATVFAIPTHGPPKLHFSPQPAIFAQARWHASEPELALPVVVGAAVVVPAAVFAVDVERGVEDEGDEEEALGGGFASSESPLAMAASGDADAEALEPKPRSGFSR